MAVHVVLLDADVDEPVGAAGIGERLRLLGCPAVAVEPLGAGCRVALAGEEPTAGTEHPAGLGQAGGCVASRAWR